MDENYWDLPSSVYRHFGHDPDGDGLECNRYTYFASQDDDHFDPDLFFRTAYAPSEVSDANPYLPSAQPLALDFDNDFPPLALPPLSPVLGPHAHPPVSSSPFCFSAKLLAIVDGVVMAATESANPLDTEDLDGSDDDALSDEGSIVQSSAARDLVHAPPLDFYYRLEFPDGCYFAELVTTVIGRRDSIGGDDDEHASAPLDGDIAKTDLDFSHTNGLEVDDEVDRASRKRKRGSEKNAGIPVADESVDFWEAPAWELTLQVIPGSTRVTTIGGIGGPQVVSENPDELYLCLHSKVEDASLPFDIRGGGISRKHLRITWDNDHGWVLEVLGKNGAYVNEDFHQYEERVRLMNEDVISVRGVAFVFSDQQLEKDEIQEMTEQSRILGGPEFADEPLANKKLPWTERLATARIRYATKLERAERQAHAADPEAVSGVHDDDDDDDEEDSESGSDSESESENDKEAGHIKHEAGLEDEPRHVGSSRDELVDSDEDEVSEGEEEQANGKEAAEGVPSSKATKKSDSKGPSPKRIKLTVSRKPTKAETKAEKKLPTTPASKRPSSAQPTSESKDAIASSEATQKRRGPGRPPADGIMSKRERRERAKAIEAGIPYGDPLPTKSKLLRTESEVNGDSVEPTKKSKKKRDRSGTVGDDGGDDGGGEGNETSSPKVPRAPSPKESDYPPERLAKPDETYQALLYIILSEKGEPMPLPQIYQALKDKWPYYRFRVESKGWESSVRHNLQACPCFVKLDKSGKGYNWALNPDEPYPKKTKRASPPATQPPSAFQPPRPQQHGLGIPVHGPHPGYPSFTGQQPLFTNGHRPPGPFQQAPHGGSQGAFQFGQQVHASPMLANGQRASAVNASNQASQQPSILPPNYSSPYQTNSMGQIQPSQFLRGANQQVPNGSFPGRSTPNPAQPSNPNSQQFPARRATPSTLQNQIPRTHVQNTGTTAVPSAPIIREPAAIDEIRMGVLPGVIKRFYAQLRRISGADGPKTIQQAELAVGWIMRYPDTDEGVPTAPDFPKAMVQVLRDLIAQQSSNAHLQAEYAQNQANQAGSGQHQIGHAFSAQSNTPQAYPAQQQAIQNGLPQHRPAQVASLQNQAGQNGVGHNVGHAGVPQMRAGPLHQPANPAGPVQRPEPAVPAQNLAGQAGQSAPMQNRPGQTGATQIGQTGATQIDQTGAAPQPANGGLAHVPVASSTAQAPEIVTSAASLPASTANPPTSHHQ